jgi:H/ACA ribonucleoprotein complex non-core subunit NAF1
MDLFVAASAAAPRDEDMAVPQPVVTAPARWVAATAGAADAAEISLDADGDAAMGIAPVRAASRERASSDSTTDSSSGEEAGAGVAARAKAARGPSRVHQPPAQGSVPMGEGGEEVDGGGEEDEDEEEEEAEEEEEEGGGKAVLLTKNETPLTAVQVPDLPPASAFEADLSKLAPAGTVLHVTRQDQAIVGHSASSDASRAQPVVIVVQASKGSPPLADGTVFCTSTGAPVGRVEDLFGPVTAPCYLLRSTTAVALGVTADSVLYHSTERADRIAPEAIAAASGKGSDASNLYDEEVAASDAEYSDDEAEASARHAAKLGKRKGRHDDGGGADAVARRGDMAAAAAAAIGEVALAAPAALEGTVVDGGERARDGGLHRSERGGRGGRGGGRGGGGRGGSAGAPRASRGGRGGGGPGGEGGAAAFAADPDNLADHMRTPAAMLPKPWGDRSAAHVGGGPGAAPLAPAASPVHGAAAVVAAAPAPLAPPPAPAGFAAILGTYVAASPHAPAWPAPAAPPPGGGYAPFHPHGYAPSPPPYAGGGAPWGSAPPPYAPSAWGAGAPSWPPSAAPPLAPAHGGWAGGGYAPHVTAPAAPLTFAGRVGVDLRPGGYARAQGTHPAAGAPVAGPAAGVGIGGGGGGGGGGAAAAAVMSNMLSMHAAWMQSWAAAVGKK